MLIFIAMVPVVVLGVGGPLVLRAADTLEIVLSSFEMRYTVNINYSEYKTEIFVEITKKYVFCSVEQGLVSVEYRLVMGQNRCVECWV